MKQRIAVDIDDVLARNAESFVVEHTGISALLFGEFAWNRSAEVPDRAVRVGDWEAVEEYLKGVRT